MSTDLTLGSTFLLGESGRIETIGGEPVLVLAGGVVAELAEAGTTGKYDPDTDCPFAETAGDIVLPALRGVGLLDISRARIGAGDI